MNYINEKDITRYLKKFKNLGVYIKMSGRNKRNVYNT